MNKFSLLLLMNKMQIKTTVRHTNPTRIAKIEKTDNIKYQEGHGATGTLIHGW